MASAYSRAFFRWNLQGNTSFRPYFTAEVTPPPSVGGARLEVNWIPPASTGNRLDVNLFSSAAHLTTDDLGGAVTTSGAVSACGPPGFCTTGSPGIAQEPHTQAGQLHQAYVQWSAPGTSIRNGFDAPRDLTGGSILLRVGVDFGVAQPTPDFSIGIEDDSSHSNTVAVTTSTQPLFIPPGSSTSSPYLPRETMQTVRIPVSAFSGVDVSRVQSIDLNFDRTANGAVTVADLMITGTAAPLSGPPAQAPEVPSALLLPAAAAIIATGALLLTRRRARRRPAAG